MVFEKFVECNEENKFSIYTNELQVIIMEERKWPQDESTVLERMDLELHDYPPSGANGRHTPRVPYP